MINEIIKRDGTQQPFSAEKVNGWGEWASESLGKQVDWPSVVMAAVSTLPEVCTSADLQNALIKECLDRDTWSYNRMAGRLYAALTRKEIHPNGEIPTVRSLHRLLQFVNFMCPLDYSDEEYAQVEKFIKHKRDFNYAHFQHHHIRFKYSLRDRLGGKEYETPQFTFMRMAMALAEDQPRHRRMNDVKEFYDHFSKNIINAPTPNYVNLGTHHNGFASCCLYTTYDTADSLAVGDHIAYMMTVQSAGIGNNLQIRSKGDPIRGGLIVHQGKLPYLKAMDGAVHANMQNGRAGACNSYYSVYDPEVETLQALKNPMTPTDKQIRGMDYTMIFNRFLARKAAKKEDIFLFNVHTAPDLYAALYSGDEKLFASLYEKYENDPSMKKEMIPARKLVLTNRNEAFETGRSYFMNADEVNYHTPSKDPVVSSNLCVEICEPTEGYMSMKDLYTSDSVGYIEFIDHEGRCHSMKAPHEIELVNKRKYKYIAAQDLQVGDVFTDKSDETGASLITVKEIIAVKREPEVALCSLGAIVITNIHSDEEYEKAAYYTLLMIDKCIHKSEYVLPHVGYTAKNRMSAGVGIMDLAHHLARRGLKYSSQEGKEEVHRVAERHSYFLIKASLKLGKELGNAPWMHRTKWSEGWLPIDTYNRNVDKIVNIDLTYDWEALRAQIIENKGIRNSFLVAYMPGESSSKASGVVNSIYPVRDRTMIKTDNDITTYWAAPESDKLGDKYEPAWDIPINDMTDNYAVIQKFTDQSISADWYRRLEGSEKVTTDEMLSTFLYAVSRGLKTQYYMNVKTAKKVTLKKPSDVFSNAGWHYDVVAQAGGVIHDAQAMYPVAVDGVTVTGDVVVEGEVSYVYEENTSDSAGCGSGGCTL